MELQAKLQQAAELLQPWTRWKTFPQPDLLTISLSRNDLLAAIEALVRSRWGYLSAITGIHLPGTAAPTEEKQWTRTSEEDNIHSAPQDEGDSFLVLYTFCSGAAILNLRLHPPSLKDNRVPSVCGLIPSATLYERELLEMFGIEVTDTPNTDHLLLPDEWPQNVFPLRKGFTGLNGNGYGKG
ncbi:MAG: NADH-quinone oxidoreductase subunit C [Anaerolineaceae bacterium]|nr:NADH-quinone oxidoreductase subunit C [Anaerolineaceae bacterium]